VEEVMMSKLRADMIRSLVQPNIFKKVQDIINVGKLWVLNVRKLRFPLTQSLSSFGSLRLHLVKSVLEIHRPVGIINHPAIFHVVPHNDKDAPCKQSRNYLLAFIGDGVNALFVAAQTASGLVLNSGLTAVLSHLSSEPWKPLG
jgi:hypothetical protein